MANLTPAQITALGTEITNDPKVLGYAGKTVAQRCALINAVGGSGEKINQGIVSAQFIMSQIVETEMAALTSTKLQELLVYVSAGMLDSGNTNVRTGLGNIFGVGTTSRTNLLAAVDRSASRAEILFGSGAFVDTYEMGRATGVPS